MPHVGSFFILSLLVTAFGTDEDGIQEVAKKGFINNTASLTMSATNEFYGRHGSVLFSALQ